MNNDTTILNDTQKIDEKLTVNKSHSNFFSSIKKILIYFKPTPYNLLITFISFITALAIGRKISIALLIAVISYLTVSLIDQLILRKKLFKYFPNLSNERVSSSSRIISSNGSSFVLFLKGNKLIGISLLRIDWITDYIYLKSIWDFLEEEKIQIQDCREGCFLIIRKEMKLERTALLQKLAIKMVKEIEKTVFLIKKKFELEFENLNLVLVKGQENILTILNLGLNSNRFANFQVISEDDIEYINNSSKQIQDSSIENKEVEMKK